MWNLRNALILFVSVLACAVGAQTVVIDFENIPAYPTPVDSFGQMFPGLTLVSSNTWLADEVYTMYFQNISNRTISTYDGTLRISFAAPVSNVTMDFGSGNLGDTLTIGVTGQLANQQVFSNSFVTHQVPEGADEVRAYNTGLVDTILVNKTGGGSWLTMDNLSYVVPEPTTAALGAMGLGWTAWRRRVRNATPIPFSEETHENSNYSSGQGVSPGSGLGRAGLSPTQPGRRALRFLHFG